MVLVEARILMNIRPTLLSLFASAGVAVASVAIAWAQEAGPIGESERARAAKLKLGEELPPPRPEEDQATTALVEGTVGPMKKQAGPTIQRDQHPKHHGCVRATFTVAKGLPEHLRVGVFRQPLTYHAVIRFSNGAAKDDNVPDARGMAIKLLGVEGPSLIEGEADAGTQDFILIDHPVFFAIDPKELVGFTGARRTLAEAKKAGDNAKAGETVKQFPKSFAILQQMGKLGTPSPLEMTYFSETPYRLGEHAVKYVATPDPANKSERPPITKDSPVDALQAAMIAHLTTGRKPATFAFGIQIQTDPVKMPVEDPTVLWDSEPITVATIAISPQEFARENQLKFCEDLSYTPWHTREPHQPLGGINRARKPVYQATSAFRHKENKVDRKEPTLADLDRLFKADAGSK